MKLQIQCRLIFESKINIWNIISILDKYINETKPWTKKNEPEFISILVVASNIIFLIDDLLEPFLPDTVNKIRLQIFKKDKEIIFKKGPILFPRIKKNVIV